MILQVGVKALIKNDKDQYLFLRRSTTLITDTGETSWDIPGGRIDVQEDLLTALRREIKEEIGQGIVSIPELIDAQDIFVPTKDLHVVRLTYVIKENVSDIVLSDEHDEYEWIDEANIAAVKAEPYLAETLRRL